MLCSSKVFSQGVEPKLKELGFENIVVAQSNDTMFVSYEDPVYRGTFRGAGVLLKNLSMVMPSITHYELIVKEDNVEKIAVHANVNAGKWTIGADYDNKSVERIKGDASLKKNNSSYGKVNVTLFPIVSLDNHVTYKLFNYNLMIAPAVETCLWKGGHLSIQPIIPILNNNDGSEYTPEYSNVQFGSVNVQQDFLYDMKWWGRASVGFFHYNYLGVGLEFGHHLTRYFDLSININAVKRQWLKGSSMYFEGNLFSALVTASYYEPHSSVEAKLTCGRYLYDDYGARLDGICHFGEYLIGLYGIYAGGEYNAGFHFSIPFAGKKQKRMGAVSLRMPEYFDWEYNMVSNFDWVYKKCGRDLERKVSRNLSGEYWQAKYIRKYLQLYLDGDIE